jgi:exodeoxyribonuclease V gamma subunit
MTQLTDIPNLTVYTSNHVEELVKRLAEVIEKPLKSPLAPETIVVQSKGMERWIAMALAGMTGVCANVRFPFPNTFLQDLFNTFLPDLPERSGFDPGTLTFAIMTLLPELVNEQDFDRLKAYLNDDDRTLKKYQICEQLADVFDQYSVFRPEMIFSWETGGGNHWQAKLWRRLSKAYDLTHRARLQKLLIERIARSAAGVAPSIASLGDGSIPERISLFGISYLPPIYLQTFAAISHLIEVNLFLLNPCREYWGDIVSDREMQKAARKTVRFDSKKESLHIERGNRLLSSMGMLGRNFLHLLSDLECQTAESFIDPGDQTTLSSIQSDILNLKDCGNRSQDSISDVSNRDDTVQIHSCHSTMREIEILHDNLLSMFQADPNLHPRDVVVMAPDIERYTSYVHAVFDAQADETLRIPFSVSDQRARRGSSVIDAFFSLFDLKESRLSASDVMRCLEYTAIREAFGLSENDITVVQRWIRDTRICWGLDADARTGLGLPGFSENTWKAGIERLLLGYAMKGSGEDMFLGILPYNEIEGSDVPVLGRFLDFMEMLADTVRSMKTPKTLTDWRHALMDMIERFFSANENTERDLHAMRSVAGDLQICQEISGFNDPVEFDVIRAYINLQIEKRHFSAGFITGGVTFCAMLPMRSIPFKIVCLIGMNHDAFPRETRTPAFNLILAYPRPGDRSRRHDDRYLFLEALISARQKFYVSYIGQDIQDNTRKPPSVLVSELIDYIREGFDIPEDHLVTTHRLQAFSRTYFTKGSGFFSYTKDNFDAARRLFDRQGPAPFISKRLSPLTDDTPGYKTLDLGSLGSFFVNPSRFLLQRRLGIHIETRDPVLPQRERFNLNALERHIISQRLLRKRLSGRQLSRLFAAQQAAGSLPHGNVGSAIYQEMSADIDAFVNRIDEVAVGDEIPAVDLQLSIAGFTLNGRFTEIFEHGLTLVKFVKKKPRDLLDAWICHLGLCCSEHMRPTILIFRDSAVRFHPVQQAERIMAELLSVYWEGLQVPVHFFPETSHEFADLVINRSRQPEHALQAAEKKWEGNDYTRGESQDPYIDLCFRHADPFDETFQGLALSVFTPLFEHCEKMPW